MVILATLLNREFLKPDKLIHDNDNINSDLQNESIENENFGAIINTSVKNNNYDDAAQNAIPHSIGGVMNSDKYITNDCENLREIDYDDIELLKNQNNGEDMSKGSSFDYFDTESTIGNKNSSSCIVNKMENCDKNGEFESNLTGVKLNKTTGQYEWPEFTLQRSLCTTMISETEAYRRCSDFSAILDSSLANTKKPDLSNNRISWRGTNSSLSLDFDAESPGKRITGYNSGLMSLHNNLMKTGTMTRFLSEEFCETPFGYGKIIKYNDDGTVNVLLQNTSEQSNEVSLNLDEIKVVKMVSSPDTENIDKDLLTAAVKNHLCSVMNDRKISLILKKKSADKGFIQTIIDKLTRGFLCDTCSGMDHSIKTEGMKTIFEINEVAQNVKIIKKDIGYNDDGELQKLEGYDKLPDKQFFIQYYAKKLHDENLSPMSIIVEPQIKIKTVKTRCSLEKIEDYREILGDPGCDPVFLKSRNNVGNASALALNPVEASKQTPPRVEISNKRDMTSDGCIQEGKDNITSDRRDHEIQSISDDPTGNEDKFCEVIYPHLLAPGIISHNSLFSARNKYSSELDNLSKKLGWSTNWEAISNMTGENVPRIRKSAKVLRDERSEISYYAPA